MILHISSLTESDARAALSWWSKDNDASSSSDNFNWVYGYQSREIDNHSEWNKSVEQCWGIADERIRRKEYYSLRNDRDKLLGFFRLQEEGTSLLLCIGLTPEYCGAGLERAMMPLVLQEAKRKAPGKRLEVEVYATNRRARECYARCGFSVVQDDDQCPSGGVIRMVYHE
jgi:ribosomal protein S18 acetylase RimI-like enzyme